MLEAVGFTLRPEIAATSSACCVAQLAHTDMEQVRSFSGCRADVNGNDAAPGRPPGENAPGGENVVLERHAAKHGQMCSSRDERKMDPHESVAANDERR